MRLFNKMIKYGRDLYRDLEAEKAKKAEEAKTAAERIGRAAGAVWELRTGLEYRPSGSPNVGAATAARRPEGAGVRGASAASAGSRATMGGPIWRTTGW